MAFKLKIHKGDTVQVIAGADKGKKGSVLSIQKKEKKIRIKIQGVKMMTHFDQQEGRHEAEGFIDYSNVKLVEKKAATKGKAKKSKSK